MAYRSSCTCIWFCVYVTLVVTTIATHNDRLPRETWKWHFVLLERSYNNTNERHMSCPGPVAHYKSLNCLPVYIHDQKKIYDCPVKYDCTHLNDQNKCFVNDQEYNVGQVINQRDLTYCYQHCVCNKDGDGPAEIKCNVTGMDQMCPSHTSIHNGTCYPHDDLFRCCPRPYCPIKLQQENYKRPMCEVNGIKYYDGEYVVVKERPDLICVCHMIHEGRNENRPLCVKSDSWFWADLQAASYFYKGCAPVYRQSNLIYTDFKVLAWRCPNNDTDRITHCAQKLPERVFIATHHHPQVAIAPTEILAECDKYIKENSNNTVTPPMAVMQGATPHRVSRINSDASCLAELWYRSQCIFGHRRMHVGDTLNNIKYGEASCIVCSCEVPPVPTCIMTEKAECET